MREGASTRHTRETPLGEPQSDEELSRLTSALLDAIAEMEESLHKTTASLGQFAYNRNTPAREQSAVRLHQRFVDLVRVTARVRGIAINLNNELW